MEHIKIHILIHQMHSAMPFARIIQTNSSKQTSVCGTGSLMNIARSFR